MSETTAAEIAAMGTSGHLQVDNRSTYRRCCNCGTGWWTCDDRLPGSCCADCDHPQVGSLCQRHCHHGTRETERVGWNPDTLLWEACAEPAESQR